MKILTECSECFATGVFQGNCEPANTGLVCHTCTGRGSVMVSKLTTHDVLFVKRRIRTGIQTVEIPSNDTSYNSAINVDWGPNQNSSIAYEKFLNLKIPPEIECESRKGDVD